MSCEEFDQLTRLERITEITPEGKLVTASGRVFSAATLESTLDTTLTQGEALTLRGATPQLISRFKELELERFQRSMLQCIVWEEYIKNLTGEQVAILFEATRRIRGNSPESASILRRKWYFVSDLPRWVPEGTRFLIETIKGDFLADKGEGQHYPVSDHHARIFIRHKLLRQTTNTNGRRTDRQRDSRPRSIQEESEDHSFRTQRSLEPALLPDRGGDSEVSSPKGGGTEG